MQDNRSMIADDDQAIASAACDKLLEVATATMVNQAGAPVDMVIDRIVTYAAAQLAMWHGSTVAAQMLRDAADKVEAGLFHKITGEKRPARRAH